MIKKSCLNKSKFSSGFVPIKHGMKKKFLSILVLVSEIVILCLKRKALNEFPQKCVKTTERHSLAVCGSLCGEKQFLLIFIPFYWFEQKKLFKQILIFLSICSFQTWSEKKKILSILVLVSEIVTFISKKKGSLWISTKMLQNNRKA